MPEMPDERDPRGWGHIAQRATPAERDGVRAMLAARFGADAVWTAPQAIQPVRRPPRPRIPAALSHLISADPDVRLLHAVGRSFSDLVALRETGVDLLPDLVATPTDAAGVRAVLEWCADDGLACIPFGGGTSVVGGVTAGGVADQRAVVTLQTRAMDSVIEVDRTSRAALIQAGATGPGL
ncbi:MAG TPA: FAD-binding protein, partial [Euzebya sp.]|nr:FAD-binding protein [Euzebya sp.]